MNRITAIMTAFLVLLLLASGFMAADNIRLSGERAAIAEELNQQNYDYAILTRRLENQQKALDALTLERDELLLQLQDYQPTADPTADQPADDDPLVQSILESAEALPVEPSAPIPTPTVAPTSTPDAAPTAQPTALPLPQADAVTEDIFALETPAPTSAPAFQNVSAGDSHQLNLLVTDMARLRQRITQLETRLDLVLSIKEQQALPATPAPASFAPGEILRKIHDNLLFFFGETKK